MMILTNATTTTTTKVLFLISVLLFLSHTNTTTACTDEERQILLSFLNSLSAPLQSWNPTIQSDCCKWEGIACNPSNSVTQLSLPSKGLTGEISPVLSNLTNLSYLNLSCNSLSGLLPVELLSLSTSLTVLDVSFNKLSGVIPAFRNPVIQVLNISSNFLTGLLPVINATSLVSLNTTNNSLTGPIPDFLCKNSPFLVSLAISYNKFSGAISPGLGNCRALRDFQAVSSNLTGLLPDELFNLASLEHLYLSNNRIYGSLNGTLIARLQNLVSLDLGTNSLTGSLPESIGKLSKLQCLHLNGNNLTGTLPSAIENCTDLRQLNLRENNFTGNLEFINFTKLSSLQLLDLYNNSFTGEIPESIYTCKNLNALRLSNNKLNGPISPLIGNLRALSFLSLALNTFENITSTLQTVSKCKNLTALLISRSFIGDSVPNEPAWENGFENIQVLSMGSNNFTGTIPSWISKLTKLEVLDITGNHFTGPIPDWLANLSSLFYLDLSKNYLSGNIPQSVARLPLLNSVHKIARLDPGYLELPLYRPINGSRQQYKQLTALPCTVDLSNNHLTGTIPQEIGQLTMLLKLDLSQNNLSGSIPNSIGNLTNLETLDLSRNMLTGLIPASLTQLHFLSTFSVASNNLSGPIPTGGQFNTFSSSSYENNSNLCGHVVMRKCSGSSSGENKEAPLTSKRFNKKTVIAVVLGIFFGVAAVVLLLGYYYITSIRRSKHKLVDVKMGLPNSSFNSLTEVQLQLHLMKGVDLVMVKGETDISFQDILTATNNFDQSSIVGCGGFGLVYKAELASGAKLAIKRLSGNSWLMDREFKAEVQALSVAQHENLVPLKGYCIHGDLRLLIYSYMENGSLDDWLHDQGSHDQSSDSSEFVCQLDWPTRLRIAQGASRGLSYIHEECSPHIVHRDIKCSNILLDKDFEAHVADFGLARLIQPYMTHVTTELIGTLGYIPPEYGQGCVATLRGDIYSFGVVMLELLTGKRAVEVLPGRSVELVQWVRELKLVGREAEAFDPFLRGKGYDGEMLKVLDVACCCVDYNPVNRPSIQQVVAWLQNANASLPS